MTNALDAARQALAAARDKITAWDDTITTARRAREEAQQAAPTDPAELDEYADRYARAEGRVRAAENGRRAAEASIVPALESIIRAGLDDARAELKRAESEHAAHRRKVDALLTKLSQLDDADYRPTMLEDVAPMADGRPMPGTYSVKASKAATLAAAVSDARAVVDVLEELLGGDLRADRWGAVPGDLRETARQYVDARKAAGIPTAAEAAHAEAIERERLADEQEPRQGWTDRVRGVLAAGAK